MKHFIHGILIASVSLWYIGCDGGGPESGGTAGQAPSGDCRNQGQECGAAFQCRQNAASTRPEVKLVYFLGYCSLRNLWASTG